MQIRDQKCLRQMTEDEIREFRQYPQRFKRVNTPDVYERDWTGYLPEWFWKAVGAAIILLIVFVIFVAPYVFPDRGGGNGSCTDWDVTAGGVKVCVAADD